MGDHCAPRAQLTVSLNQHIVRQLEAACDDDAADIGSYLDHVVLQRTCAWRRSVHRLEAAGWAQEDVIACHERLQQVLFFDFFDERPRELALELRIVGLRWLAWRIACRPKLARALWCVLLELRARNVACTRAVGLMRPRLSWWGRFMRSVRAHGSTR